MTVLRALLLYAIRLIVPTRRLLLVLPLAGGALFGLLALLSPRPPLQAYDDVTRAAIHTVVLPLTCLVLGDAALGAELRSGSFSLTWLSPVRRSSIVLTRWCGAMAMA